MYTLYSVFELTVDQVPNMMLCSSTVRAICSGNAMVTSSNPVKLSNFFSGLTSIAQIAHITVTIFFFFSFEHVTVILLSLILALRCQIILCSSWHCLDNSRRSYILITSLQKKTLKLGAGESVISI